MLFRPFLLAAALFLASSAMATDCVPPGTETLAKKDIAGGVEDAGTGKPLSAVTVTVYAANRKEVTATTTTDASGNYAFHTLKPGTYKFVFEKGGYKKLVREKVIVRSDDSMPLHVELQEAEDDLLFLPGLLFSDFE